MNIHLLTIGKCREKPIIALLDEYTKRLQPFAKFHLVELPHASGRPEEIKVKEAETLRSKIPNGSLVIALDERGKQFKTSAFAKWLQTQQDQGQRDIVFMIGGAEGLDPSVRKQANLVLSFSEFTFPHMMVRPLLAEQLYRCFSYNAGHPYHRED